MLNGILYDWSRVPLKKEPAKFRIEGVLIYVNPDDKKLSARFSKGDSIFTSEVVNEIRVSGDRLVITRAGSRYLCVGGCIPCDPALRAKLKNRRS
jgi:hypothetical protein